MKEILQTKFLKNLKSTFACASAHFCIIALHVVTVEAEAEESEELPQEFEIAIEVEEPVPDANFPNSESQPGKPRFILNPVSYIKVLSFTLLNILCIKFIGIV